MQKRGAIEMSIGTIVIIVLAVSMLIFGMIFIRSIMCSGIIISEQISTNVQNEVRGLFGANQLGVKCMGEAGEEVKVADGGRRSVVCMIKEEENKEYDLKLVEITSLKGVPTADVQKWVLSDEWKGTGKVGETQAAVVVLDIPKNTQTTSLKLTIEETTGAEKATHISIIDVTHVGTFTSAIC